MSNIKFKCQECGQSLEAPPDMAGEGIKCPACKRMITIPISPSPPKKEPLRLVPAPTSHYSRPETHCPSPVPSPSPSLPEITKNIECEETKPEAELRGIHWVLAAPLSGWCLYLLLLNGYSYLFLTWHIFTTLKWFSFVLFLSPCFWIWMGLFSAATWAPFPLVFLPWGKYGKNPSRKVIILIVLLAPLLLSLALQYIGPYFYPITYGGENGTHVYLRFIPILGGSGYD